MLPASYKLAFVNERSPPTSRAGTRRGHHGTARLFHLERCRRFYLDGWFSRDRSRAGCPRGDLDKAYCDRDGDLVADAPTDPKQLVNPSTLVFAYTPVEDPAVCAKAWEGFIKYMEQTTGKKVVFFPVQSNAAEIEAMRSDRLHVAGFNTGSNPIAVNCAGFVPFAIMGNNKGQFGYEMEIIVPADSAIKTPADLKGKKVAFTEPTSNSGYKAPSAILKADFNLEAGRDFTAAFSGKHDNSQSPTK